MAQNKIWYPLESNPDSMNAYLKKLGQSKLQCLDVYGFDKELLDMLPQPVQAIIFLYPLTNESNEKETQNDSETKNMDNVWFIKQTIHNSCGTVALLHVLGNLKDQFPLDEDSIMDIFFKKVQSMTPEERAKELENMTKMETLHHEFAEKTESQIAKNLEVDTHFIVFLPMNGHIFELDGRKKEPVIHCSTSTENFLYDLGNIVKDKFINKSSNDIRFSALAVVSESIL